MYILDDVLKGLEKSVMQFNSVKYKWDHFSASYIGFMVKQEVIKLQTSKIKAIMGIETPKTKLRLVRLIGMVNLY